MSLKSRSIFKNLSAVFLLLLIVTAIFVPFEAAKAAGDFLSFDIFGNIEDWIAKALLGDNMFMRAIYFLIYQVLNMCLLAITILVYFGSWLIDVFLDEAIYLRVLDMTDPTSAVRIGWTTIRDACNTFFILFLLLIAFSTILRIQTYNAKSLLPKFIISLFLINFSATIAMMVIDFGQVFMFEIKTWMGAGGFSEAGSPLTTIVDRFNLKYNFKSPTEKYLLEDVVGIGFAVAYSVVLGLLYVMLALFLLVRIIVFVILVIISPFAFFSIILPGMRTYTSQWWSSLVSHAIFGPVFLFFIFLSGKMAQSMHGFTSTVNKPKDIDSLSFIIAELIPHVVALGMLFAAIPVTQKLGAAGSSKIIGGAAGIGKIAAGTYAGVKLAGGLGKKTGAPITRRTGIPDKIRRGTDSVKGRVAGNKWAQKAGVSKIILSGQAGGFGKQRDQVEKEKKGWINSAQKDNLYGELKNSKGKSSAEIAAIIERMSEKKMLNEKDVKSHKLEGQTLANILSRAKPALDADKLKESMPHWAAMVEAGPGPGKENIIKGRTKEITTEMIEENKLGSLNDAALERADVAKTIYNQHDDPDKWAASQSTKRKESINIGLGEVLKANQEVLNTSGTDINNVDGTTLYVGKEGNVWRKEIDSIQKSLAKNDKDGHIVLKDPEIKAGKIVLDADGKIDFNAVGASRNIGREEKYAKEMKTGGYKYKSEEFFQHTGGHLGYNNFEQLRREGNEDQMKAAVQGQKTELKRIQKKKAKVGLSTEETNKLNKINETLDKLRKNTYYENLV